MITISLLNIIGLSANIIGTIILAFSLGKVLKALGTAIKAHELFIDTYTSGGDIVHLAGTDEHVKRGAKTASTLTMWGVILVIVGFVLQLFQYLPAEWISSFILK